MNFINKKFAFALFFSIAFAPNVVIQANQQTNEQQTNEANHAQKDEANHAQKEACLCADLIKNLTKLTKEFFLSLGKNGINISKAQIALRNFAQPKNEIFKEVFEEIELAFNNLMSTLKEVKIKNLRVLSAEKAINSALEKMKERFDNLLDKLRKHNDCATKIIIDSIIEAQEDFEIVEKKFSGIIITTAKKLMLLNNIKRIKI